MARSPEHSVPVAMGMAAGNYRQISNIMWIYVQSSGQLLHDGKKISQCYSGHGEHKNCPASQNLKGLGPIPCGIYTIGLPFDSTTHGPFCLPLIPDPTNTMWGRSAFLIHGERKPPAKPGMASLGCIIAGLSVRHAMAASGDSLLKVVSEPADALAL